MIYICELVLGPMHAVTVLCTAVEWKQGLNGERVSVKGGHGAPADDALTVFKGVDWQC